MTTDYPSKGQRNAFRGLRKDEGTTFSASCKAVQLLQSSRSEGLSLVGLVSFGSLVQRFWTGTGATRWMILSDASLTVTEMPPGR